MKYPVRNFPQTQGIQKWLVMVLLSISAMAISLPTQAEVKPNSLFSDGTVLQRGIEVPVWGTARDGEEVKVRFQGEEVSTKAKDGKWSVRLKKLKTGGPFVMTITGDNTVTLTNVLVGEVWLCSGQSNMGFQLYRAANAQEAMAAAGDSELRLFSVPHEATDEPKSDVGGCWKESSSVTASNFSAVAYFFGRELRRKLNVPIGLIDSSVGGTPAQAWTSRATLESKPELRAILDRDAESVRNYKAAVNTPAYKEALRKHNEKLAKAKAEGKKAPAAPAILKNVEISSQRPCGLYNAMIAPLQPYALAGVTWYQGEANSGRAAEYQTLFPAMIRNWRQAWGQGDFPFLFVQIAPYKTISPEIREAQLLTWQRVPNTAMAVTVDVGDANDIHPTRKEPVGVRLALAAEAIKYGEKVEYSGPVYEAMKVKGESAVLSFNHVGKGLVANGGELKGFKVAGEDGKFVDAMAKIDGKNVIVSSTLVSKPVAVRYGWDKVPDVNLFNQEGLPASPFRTDVK